VDDLDRAVAVIDGAEMARWQLQEFRAAHGAQSTDAVRQLLETAEALEARFTTLEARLYQLYGTGRGQDAIRWPMRTAQQIGSLIGNVESSDFPPTEQHRAVAGELRAEVEAAVGDYEALVAGPLADFNRELTALGLAGIMTGR
jgi:hypothetical protein